MIHQEIPILVFQKPYSDKTAELIDEEAKQIVAVQYERAKQILKDNAEGHNQLAELLIEKEVIFAEDLERIFGKRPWVSRQDELMAQNGTTEIENTTESLPEAQVTETTDEPTQENA